MHYYWIKISKCLRPRMWMLIRSDFSVMQAKALFSAQHCRGPIEMGSIYKYNILIFQRDNKIHVCEIAILNPKFSISAALNIFINDALLLASLEAFVVGSRRTESRHLYSSRAHPRQHACSLCLLPQAQLSSMGSGRIPG